MRCQSYFLPNVKEHATPLAGAGVETGREVHATGGVADSAAFNLSVEQALLSVAAVTSASSSRVRWRGAGRAKIIDRSLRELDDAKIALLVRCCDGRWWSLPSTRA